MSSAMSSSYLLDFSRFVTDSYIRHEAEQVLREAVEAVEVQCLLAASNGLRFEFCHFYFRSTATTNKWTSASPSWTRLFSLSAQICIRRLVI